MLPDPHEYPPYFQKYLDLLPDAPVQEVLAQNIQVTRALLSNVTEEQGQFAYAPGKWTLKQMLGHMADVERVFTYRLLRAARGDSHLPLHLLSDDDWAEASPVQASSLLDLSADLLTVRAGTLAVLRPLSTGDWFRPANVNGQSISIRAMACIIAGHEMHHQHLIREKYLLT